MPDTLSQGGDREPSRWPRRVAALAVLVLAAALIAVHLPRSQQPRARPDHAAASVTPSAVPSAAGASEAAEPAVAAPNGITGPVLSWPGGLRLVTNGQRPAWFWPGTGQTVPIGGLPAQHSGYEFTRVAGGWAILADPGIKVGCTTCAGPGRAVYFLADRAQSATPVGLAYAVAPAGAGALWLTSYPRNADPRTAAGTAREVSVNGTPLGPPLKLPAGFQVERSIDRGLLLAPLTPELGGTVYQVWDPASPHSSRTFSAVIAASATQIAWTPPCGAHCQLRVADLATGQQVTAVLPDGRSAVNAAFSPDGRFLAVEESFSNEGDDGGQAVQLELVSIPSGHLIAVPGTWLSSDALISFGWPASSDSLVAELGFTTKVQLMSWRPGAARLAVAAVSSRQSPGSLVVGQY